MFGDVLTRFGFYSPVFVTEHSGDNLSDLLSLKYGHTFCPNLWEVNFLFVLFLDNCFQLPRLVFSMVERNAAGWHLLVNINMVLIGTTLGRAGPPSALSILHMGWQGGAATVTVLAPHFSVLGNT